jgi:hypothetical protein
MEEGTILKWLKTDGAEVARGEEIVESGPTRRTWPTRPTRPASCG